MLGNWNRGGCRGCHVFTYHHEDNSVYRFLKGHGGSVVANVEPRKDIATYTDYVRGVEDDDWEQESVTDHNWYLGTTDDYNSNWNGLLTKQTVTAFCSGCHHDFHGSSYMGSPGNWIRHPSDFAYPNTGEYAGYNPVSNYNATAPVGWTDTTTPSGPVVMCLSCHVAHGSQYSDLLRWDYSAIVAGGGSSSAGCFVCHTTKDDGS